MNLDELRATLQFKSIPLRHSDRVLARAYSIEDLRRSARRALPRSVFDYVEGGSDEETTLQENRLAFQSRQLHPRTLNDVSTVSIETELFGSALPAPLGFSPTGYTRMMHPEGEVAVARAATSKGIPEVAPNFVPMIFSMFATPASIWACKFAGYVRLFA